jgi:flagellar basal-body rod modification protein FlgD
MTAISPLSGTTAATKTGTPTSQLPPDTGLDYNNFLQLLVTQLKSQDPLNPMDNTEYVSQLATFSNVEQNIKTNEKLDVLTTLQQVNGAQELIGHTVKPADGDAGTVSQIKVTSEGAYAVLADGRELPLGAGLTIS